MLVSEDLVVKLVLALIRLRSSCHDSVYGFLGLCHVLANRAFGSNQLEDSSIFHDKHFFPSEEIIYVFDIHPQKFETPRMIMFDTLAYINDPRCVVVEQDIVLAQVRMH